MRLHIAIAALIVSLSNTGSAFAGTPFGKNDGHERTTNRDTADAVVMYNSDVAFLPSPLYDVDFYTHLIDSLVHLDNIPVALVNQLNVYRHLRLRDPDDLFAVVDSIFESPKVPRPTINAVNLYMAAMEQQIIQPQGFYAYIPYDDSPYPANVFYNEWDINAPFENRNNLAHFDTTLTLLLVDRDQDCGFALPFAGKVTSHFGWRWGRSHNGTDIDLEVWDPVKSAFPGVVRVARVYKGYGRVVVVRHYNGLETLYAHLHRFKVKTGDVVEAGDVVGLGGSSGNSTGSHLHFEVRFQGVPLNPAALIHFREGRVKTETITLQRSGSGLVVVPQTKPAAPSVQPGAPSLASKGSGVYEVKKGDYLYKIARDHGLSVEELCAFNHLHRNQPLRVGQKLRLGS